MTDLTSQPEQADADQSEREGSRNRFLTITVGLAVALIGLGAWVVYDLTTAPDTAVTGEIQTLLDDYLGAWNNYDEEAFQEQITSSYVLHMVGGPVTITRQAEEASEMLRPLEADGWREEVIGEPIMTGDGPWYVSVVEHFTSTGYGPDGADGVSTFTIVEDGGTLKVARHSYVGNN